MACSTPGRVSNWFEEADKRAEYGWRFFQAADDFSRLAQQSLALNGHHEAQIRAGNAARGFAGAASAISASRCIFSWEKLLSGRMFFTKEGECRSWILIAIDILLLIARTLSPFTWLHALKAINLGKHAARMNTTIISAYSGVVVFYFAYVVNEVSKMSKEIMGEEKLEEYRKQIREGVVAFFDLIAFPFQCGLAAGAAPAFGIAGCVISGLSGLFFFGNELYSAYKGV